MGNQARFVQAFVRGKRKGGSCIAPRVHQIDLSFRRLRVGVLQLEQALHVLPRDRALVPKAIVKGLNIQNGFAG